MFRLVCSFLLLQHVTSKAIDISLTSFEQNGQKLCRTPDCVQLLNRDSNQFLDMSSKDFSPMYDHESTNDKRVSDSSDAASFLNFSRLKNIIDGNILNNKNESAGKLSSNLWQDLATSNNSHVVENKLLANSSFAPTKQNVTSGRLMTRLPQVLIIGVKKAGTKALLTFLSAHPDIRACKKEVHFFDKYYHKGLSWYRNAMPKSAPHQKTIEKSPRYFVASYVPKRVYEMSPRIKLLVIFRDPTKRAISDYVHMKTRKKKYEIKDGIEEMLFGNRSRDLSSLNSTHSFISNGLYSKYLKTWLRYFPRKQIHFVNGDEMITNPGKEIIAVQKFLHLDVLVNDDNFSFDTTKNFYCVHEMLDNRITRQKKAICLGKSKGRKHPQVSKETLQALRDFYKPHNEELYRLTGINFGWD